MSGNNANSQMKSVGGPAAFGNSGPRPQVMSFNTQPPPQNLAQSQPQRHGASNFPSQFHLSEPHAQALAQKQYAQVQAQARANAASVQFQPHLQAPPQSIARLQNSGGNGNAGVSSPSIATPSTGSNKRSHHKSSSKPPSSSGVGGATPSPMKSMEIAPAVRRRKRSPPRNQIPDKVAALLPESALYSQLLDFEARIDADLARKKIDIQESLKNPQRVQKTLRIYVFNTYANQSGVNKENAESPSWSLKIVGRILEDGVDPDAAALTQTPTTAYPKFSSFFKKITIYLDQGLYPDNHVISWNSSRAAAFTEGFEVKRTGDKEFTAIIRLEMNYMPEKFKLSPALSEVLGVDVETRPRILAALWHYVKVKELQDPSDPSYFTCDSFLKKVFGEDRMKFRTVSQKITQHLTPPQPIHLEHRIKLSGDNPVGNTCYDVLVDVPFPLDKAMSAFLASLEKNKEIEASDEAICSAIKKIHEHRRRRAFFLGFSQSPTEFINALIASQNKDLKLASGDATHNAEKERLSEFYNQPWVDDAVIRYLNRRPTGGSEVPGST